MGTRASVGEDEEDTEEEAKRERGRFMEGVVVFLFMD